MKSACENCVNWWLENKHIEGNGFCTVFGKETTSVHGAKCTAFESLHYEPQSIEPAKERGLIWEDVKP